MAARAAGYRGAMYPWQSGSNGREETQTMHFNPRSGRWIPDHTHLQRHIGVGHRLQHLAVLQVTDDHEFSTTTAPRCCSRSPASGPVSRTYNRSLDRYEIAGVMGPDEYHTATPAPTGPGLDNNAYTNVMVAWVLERARDVLDSAARAHVRQLCERLGLTRGGAGAVGALSRLRVPFHGDGIISQFEGYGDLEEFDWDGYRSATATSSGWIGSSRAEGDTTNRYQVSKQADVLMLFYLLSADELACCSSGSATRSTRDHSADHRVLLLARSRPWFNAQSGGACLGAGARRPPGLVGALPGGARQRHRRHPGRHDARRASTSGAMAGTIDLLQRCYTGLELRGDVLWLRPRLPKALRRLRLFVRYRGHSLDLKLTGDAVEVSTMPCCAPSIRVAVNDETHDLAASERRRCPLR